jgi:hypothetical protein
MSALPGAYSFSPVEHLEQNIVTKRRGVNSDQAKEAKRRLKLFSGIRGGISKRPLVYAKTSLQQYKLLSLSLSLSSSFPQFSFPGRGKLFSPSFLIVNKLATRMFVLVVGSNSNGSRKDAEVCTYV